MGCHNKSIILIPARWILWFITIPAEANKCPNEEENHEKNVEAHDKIIEDEIDGALK
jgi:hypothetical protein